MKTVCRTENGHHLSICCTVLMSGFIFIFWKKNVWAHPTPHRGLHGSLSSSTYNTMWIMFYCASDSLKPKKTKSGNSAICNLFPWAYIFIEYYISYNKTALRLFWKYCWKVKSSKWDTSLKYSNYMNLSFPILSYLIWIYNQVYSCVLCQN